MRASADSAPQANAKWYIEQAQLYSDMGQWDAALADYEAAYAITRDPSLLVKMGNLCRRKGDSKRAIDCYRNYLDKVPNASDRPQVEGRIRELEEQGKNPASAPGAAAAAPTNTAPAPTWPSVPAANPTEAAPVPTQPGVATVAPTAGIAAAAGATGSAAETAQPAPAAGQSAELLPSSAPTAVPPSSPAQAVVPGPAPAAPISVDPLLAPAAAPPPTPIAQSTPADVSARSDEGSGWTGPRIAGAVLMAGGLVMMGVGGYFSYRTHDIESSINSSSSFDSDKYKDGQTAAAVQWVCYGIGSAAAIAGLIVYLTAPTGPSRLSLAPQLGPGIAGLGAQGVF